MKKVENTDKEIQFLIKAEERRQAECLEMIPSENYASADVLSACGSVLNNKYAEGYSGRRYYQGNGIIDKIETLAIERAKKLFKAEHVNIQPYSGSTANLAAYFALLKPGDKILGLSLSHGGHLTHGAAVNFSGTFYHFVSYGVDPETERLDMAEIARMAKAEKPRLIVSGFTAYPRLIDFYEFDRMAKEVGAYSMADISHIAGLVAGGVHPSPLPFTDIVTSTTHKTLRGPRGAMIMCKAAYAKAVDRAVFPGIQGGPHENIIAAKAIAFREALSPDFKKYAGQIVKNAAVLAEALMKSGIKLVSDGTDNHLILINLLKTPAIGKPGMGRPIAVALEEAGIVTNANTVPFDPSTPFNPSGLRLGTPILTTRGMKEKETAAIAKMIVRVIENYENKTVKLKINKEVKELCSAFPFYF